MSNVSIDELIPALHRVSDQVLRRAVGTTWKLSIKRSRYFSISDVPQSPHMVSRSLLRHVNEVNRLAVEFVEVARVEYGLEADTDLVLATAILHDVDKPLLFGRSEEGEFEIVEGAALEEHGKVGAELALMCGVREDVASLVRTHSPFASSGLPGTVEGTIVHYADFVANDLACVEEGSDPVHSSVRFVAKGRDEGVQA